MYRLSATTFKRYAKVVGENGIFNRKTGKKAKWSDTDLNDANKILEECGVHIDDATDEELQLVHNCMTETKDREYSARKKR